MSREAKVRSRAESILKHLYEHIDEVRELYIIEEGSSHDQSVDDDLMMMYVAASFAAHVIRQTSNHRSDARKTIDTNVVYEDYLFLLDKFLDEE